LKDEWCRNIVSGLIEDQEKRELEVINGVVFKEHKVYIPNDRELRTKLLEAYHDSSLAGHLGVKKTVELITRNCFWNGLEKDVTQWIKSCVKCLKNKSSTQKPMGLLKTIEVPSSN